MLVFSVSCVFAGDNETISDVVSAPSELEEITQIQDDVPDIQSSQSDEGTLEAGNNVINVHVRDTYNETGKIWVEDGFDLSNATVKVYDSSNQLVSTHKTNSKGIASINNLNSAKYYLEVSYSTYEPKKLEVVDFTQNSGTVTIDNVVFVPDILLLVDYSSHNEKVDVLMNMSKRVAYISTTDFDVTRSWLARYANYIHIDMFSESAYNVLTTKYLKELLSKSPANANYKVAYTFGVYSAQILNNTGIHIVGANSNNNTFDTVENTYIGSYFQAKDIAESDILLSNMENYLDYVYYLINPSKYPNPTLKANGTPLMSPECGFYHPDLGIYTVVPENVLINTWIRENPGYTHSSDGSLNWMVENYKDWLIEELDPTNLFKTFENDYVAKFNPQEKFIAIASYYCGEEVSEALIRSYEANGRPAFNIFKTGTEPSMSSILNKINSASSVGISAVTSLYSWSLSYANGSAEGDLSDIDLTILKGVNEISQYSYESELGPQIEWTYAVTYPSFEGVFSPVILSYVDSVGKTHVIQSGVDKMVKLSCGWANLKEMDNSDKKVAIVLWNYPPGKAEIGASYLDVFNSTYQLLIKMAEQGYDIGVDVENLIDLNTLTNLIFDMNNKGSWAKGLLNDYVEANWDSLMEHHQLITLQEFYDLTSDLDRDLYLQMINYWGDGLGPAMVYKDTYIVIPGIWFGNVFITFQPSRGWEEVQNYHDLTLPPHQQYVTFYEWLDKTAGMDAIINMGTHGTLEWLPGTNLGATKGDWTFELTLLPTIYPYIVSNPGEAMVARDRIAALTITHMTPAMVTSELYGNYTQLEDYINRYKDQLKLNVTSNAEEYMKKIIDLAPSLGFRNYSAGENFTHWIDELHLYLENMTDDFNTYGLHVLGKILTGEELVEEVVTITTSHTKMYNELLALLYPDLAGKSYYEDIRNHAEYIDVAKHVKEFIREYIGQLVNGTSVDALCEKYGIEKGSALYNSTAFAQDSILNIQNNNEWNAIFTALSGGYLKAGLFADPAYSNSIPTGYDGYASDSTRMPSEAAYESAVKIVDLLLANYFEAHGKWPELTSLILWGTEISRTEGIGVAEFLYFLGCKPIWAENGQVIGVEMLPLEDLTVKLNNGSVVNRPRVDVFASIVTSNKDWIKWMVTATNLAANAPGEDASNNYVKKHYAENPSLDRLFGLPGNILEGTGMSTLIPNTADWDSETLNSYLADIYMNRVSFSWSIDEKGNVIVKSAKDTLKYLLTNVDLITQNFDSTWRLFDSDDYYDWFGGLLNAANIYKKEAGKDAPDTAFVDIRDKNNYISRTYQQEMEFEVRTKLLNPKYYGPLITTAAGSNAYAAQMQNFIGSSFVVGAKINNNLYNQMADTLLDISGTVNDASLSAGSQSSLAWMMYLAKEGYWDADPNKLSQLANAYMMQAIQYNVACCHHTCKNLAFNEWMIQLSTLSPAMKKKFAEVLSHATQTDPLYQMEENSQTDSNQGNAQTESSGNGDGQHNANQLGNGTAEHQESQGSNSGGKTSAGNDQSATGTAQSASDSQSSQDASAADSGASGAKAYEISEQSASKSSSASESSMPIFVIIAVIVLVAIFFAGYVRKNNDEYDDY